MDADTAVARLEQRYETSCVAAAGRQQGERRRRVGRPRGGKGEGGNFWVVAEFFEHVSRYCRTDANGPSSFCRKNLNALRRAVAGFHTHRETFDSG